MIPRILSREETETFKRDGVVCLRNVISQDEVDGLRMAIADQMSGLTRTTTGYDLQSIAKQVWEATQAVETGAANRFDLSGLSALVASDDQAQPLVDGEMDKGVFFYDVAGWRHDERIRRVALDSNLPELMADLLDSERLNFWEDTTFVKTPGAAQKTAFHQDLAYFQIQGEKCVIVWIPLDHADLQNGVTRYIRGSHNWPETYAPNVFFAQTPLSKSPYTRLPDIEGGEDDYDIISFDVEPGDVIVHHVRTIHGAGANQSDSPRRAISFRYCGDDVAYLDRPGAIPQTGVKHTLQNGDPLYAMDYPLVWPRPWPGAQLSDLYADQISRQVHENDIEFA